MGGKKKPTVSQLEKRLMREQAAKSGKQQEEGRPKLKVTGQGALTQASLDAVYREIAKLPYVTPYTLAATFGLKVSAAKRALRDLEAKGLVKLVDANRRIRIYVPAGAQPAAAG